MVQYTLPKLSSLTLPWPTDWTALFGAARPLILEIGFGRGVYLFHLMRQYPDANIVGLEISNRCLDAAERTIAREKIDRVRVVHSRAETALHHLFKPASLWQIHINFPDPWFKRQHDHRRLMQRDTLDAMVSRLQTGGMLYLATDILAYAEMSAELLAATPGLDNMQATPWSLAMPGRVVTKYEATARREGRLCYYFAYRRNDSPAKDVPVIKELDMPHLVITSPLSLDDMYARFSPQQQVMDDAIVSLMRVYQSERTLLFEIFVKEPTIDQHCALLLHQHENGEYALLLSTLGHARPTAGVHRAVALVEAWLLSLHPDAKVVSRKVQNAK